VRSRGRSRAYRRLGIINLSGHRTGNLAAAALRGTYSGRALGRSPKPPQQAACNSRRTAKPIKCACTRIYPSRDSAALICTNPRNSPCHLEGALDDMLLHTPPLTPRRFAFGVFFLVVFFAATLGPTRRTPLNLLDVFVCAMNSPLVLSRFDQRVFPSTLVFSCERRLCDCRPAADFWPSVLAP
jgi:hypothetical protein